MPTVAATTQPGVTLVATQPAPATEQLTRPPEAGATGDPDEAESVMPAELEAIQLPSAAEVGDCGLPPMAIALDTVNVRSGPGLEFEIIAQMDYQDERPIIGRAAASAWWQVLLSTRQVGWVSDQAVRVAGYIGLVSVAVDSQGDDDGPPWNPTPRPDCTPPSTEEISIGEEQLAAILIVETPTTAPGDATAGQVEDGQSSSQTPSPALSPPIQDQGSGASNLIWLPIVGLLLILAGGVTLMLQRRQD